MKFQDYLFRLDIRILLSKNDEDESRRIVFRL